MNKHVLVDEETARYQQVLTYRSGATLQGSGFGFRVSDFKTWVFFRNSVICP
jgi:hypothetical protein